jgi:hypothetical protein
MLNSLLSKAAWFICKPNFLAMEILSYGIAITGTVYFENRFGSRPKTMFGSKLNGLRLK